MNEIIERASQALHDAAGTGVPWEELREQSRAFIRKMMRAAFEAMREPTIAMQEAGRCSIPGMLPDVAEDVWRDMINAALKESAPTPGEPAAERIATGPSAAPARTKSRRHFRHD